MHFDINRKTIKRMLKEPGHTVLEYALMHTALNAMNACCKKEFEANQYKQHMSRIYGEILKQFPWIKEIHEKSCAYAKQDLIQKTAEATENENADEQSGL